MCLKQGKGEAFKELWQWSPHEFTYISYIGLRGSPMEALLHGSRFYLANGFVLDPKKQDLSNKKLTHMTSSATAALNLAL